MKETFLILLYKKKEKAVQNACYVYLVNLCSKYLYKHCFYNFL